MIVAKRNKTQQMARSIAQADFSPGWLRETIRGNSTYNLQMVHTLLQYEANFNFSKRTFGSYQIRKKFLGASWSPKGNISDASAG